MKKLYLCLAIPLLLISCQAGKKTNSQIVDLVQGKFKNSTVTVTDGVEAHLSGFTGSTKSIFIDLGTVSVNKFNVIGIAYSVADTAFKIVAANSDKLPDLFRINIKASGMTSDNFDFRTVYLSKDTVLKQKINRFMANIVHSQYGKLAGDMEPGINIEPIIKVLNHADSLGKHLNGFQFIGFQHTMGVHNPDNKPIPVIYGWVYFTINGRKELKNLLFVADPANNELSSIYFEPQNIR
jgi:hypothetical protein